MSFSLILVDDALARSWEPFALTRPVGELLFGTLTLRARAEQVLGARCCAHHCAPHLEAFTEDGAPPVRSAAEQGAEDDRLFLLSRAVPAWEAAALWSERPRLAARLVIDGQTAGWWRPAGTGAPTDAEMLAAEASTEEPVIELPGRLLRYVWELVHANPAQITLDVEALHPHDPAPKLPAGAHCLGDGKLVFGAEVQVEPGVVFDTRGGPIWLDHGVRVQAFTRLAGPAYVGPGSTVLGGALEAVSIGPVCKVRGELAESICLGYVNKAHDGHIGHAYLGRWVNLGANTTNSDLKNNYGTVRLWTPDGERDTGEVKLGCLLGDHVKTGIGLLLNTGTVVGAGSNIFGAAMPPKYVPPFSWGTGEELIEYRLEKFLEVAERAMARREVVLGEEMREQLAAAWRRGRE